MFRLLLRGLTFLSGFVLLGWGITQNGGNRYFALLLDAMGDGLVYEAVLEQAFFLSGPQ